MPARNPLRPCTQPGLRPQRSVIAQLSFYGEAKVQLISETKPQVRRDRLIRFSEVERIVGLKKSTIYLFVKQGKFPAPTHLSARVIAWSESAVLQWVQDTIAGSAASMQPGGRVVS